MVAAAAAAAEEEDEGCGSVEALTCRCVADVWKHLMFPLTAHTYWRH